MKKIQVILLLIICSRYVQAQSDFDMQIDPKKLHGYLQQNKPAQQKITPLALLQVPGDTARYSHTIIQGDIYTLPQDHMPCLVPDKNVYGYNEPQVLRNQVQPFILKNVPLFINPKSGNTMPNAYREKPLVWEKKK